IHFRFGSLAVPSLTHEQVAFVKYLFEHVHLARGYRNRSVNPVQLYFGIPQFRAFRYLMKPSIIHGLKQYASKHTISVGQSHYLKHLAPMLVYEGEALAY